MKRTGHVFLYSTLLLLFTACSDTNGQQPDTTDAVETAAEESAVLGTIEATLDGETRTWYVLEGVLSGKQEYGAIWYVLEGQEEATAVFTGYDASYVPFETFEVDRETRTIDYGDYDGSIMTIMFDFPPDGSGERTFSIPQDHDASVVYVSDVSAGMTIESFYGLEQGAVTVTHIEASRTGTSRSRAPSVARW